MTSFVGYRIDPYTGEATPIAAGSEYADVFRKTLSRIAPEVNAFGAPNMAIEEKPITDEEAGLLESICAEHLDGVKK